MRSMILVVLLALSAVKAKAEGVRIYGGMVQTASIVTAAITTEKLAADSVTTPKIADGAVVTAKLNTDAVINSKVLTGAISTAKIDTDAVIASKILTGAVETAKLATDSVIEAKIISAAITTAKLASDSVTTAKIGDAQVATAKLATDAITEAKILTGAVGTSKIAVAAVVTEKLATDSVTAVKILTGAVETAKLGAAAVTASKFGGPVYALANNSVGLGIAAPVYPLEIKAGSNLGIGIQSDASTGIAAEIYPNQVGGVRFGEIRMYNATTAALNTRIAASSDNSWINGGGTFSSGCSGTGTSTSTIHACGATGNISANGNIAVGGRLIGAGAVQTATLDTDSVIASKILTGAVETVKLNTDSVTEAKILTGAVGTSKIAVAAVVTEKLATDAVTAAKILNSFSSLSKVSGAALYLNDGSTTDPVLNLGSNASSKLTIRHDSVTTDDTTISNTQASDNADIAFTLNGAERVRFKGSGNIGMGTASPFGKLSLSSGTLYLDGNGAKIEVSSGTTPVLSSCGTSPDVSSSGFGLTDIAGRFQSGTTPGTACVVTFQTAYTNIPICMVEDETTAIVSRATATTTAVTLNGVFVGGDILKYFCVGRR